MKPDLHVISHKYQTPLLEFIDHLTSLNHREDGPQFLEIDIWLSHLWNYGLDLVAYAQKEIELHRQGLVSWDVSIFGLEYHLGRYCWCLVKLDYYKLRVRSLSGKLADLRRAKARTKKARSY